MGSSVIAQAAVLAATAFAASRSTTADFALYGVVTSAAATLATCNTWAAETRAAVVAQSDARALTSAGSSVNLAFMALAVVTGAVGQGLGWDHWLSFGILIALGGGMTGYTQLLTGVVMREMRQGLLARGRLVQGLSNAILILALVLAHVPGYYALTVSWAVSLAAGNAVTMAGVPRRISWLLPGGRRDFAVLHREVQAQPLSNLLIGLAGNLPLMILPALGAVATAISGTWALINRFVFPFINTMFATLQPIYYGHAADFQRSQRLRGLRSYFALWRDRLLLAAIPVCLGVFVVLQWGLPLLGDHWTVSPVMIATALLFYGTAFVCLPLSQTLILLGRVDVQLRWSLVRSVLCIVPFFAVGVIGPQNALIAWAVVSSLTFIWQLQLHQRALLTNTYDERLLADS